MRIEKLLLIGLICGVTANATWAVNNSRLSLVAAEDKWTEKDIEAETFFGRSMAAKMLGATDLLQDDFAQSYINQLGASLAKFSSRPDLTYHFGILDSDQINAFATPGGYVFITKGALAYCQTEAELAGILAHEIGHITQRHIVKELKIRGKGADEMTGILSAAIMGGGQTASSAFQLAMNEALDIWHGRGLKNRQDEFEADKVATDILHKAGYQPDALADYLNRISTLKEHTKDRLRTHPSFEKRLASIQSHLVSLSAGKDQKNPNRMAYYLDSILSYERDKTLAREALLVTPAIEDAGFQSYLNRLQTVAAKSVNKEIFPPIFAVQSEEVFWQGYDNFALISSAFLDQINNEAEIMAVLLMFQLNANGQAQDQQVMDELHKLGYDSIVVPEILARFSDIVSLANFYGGVERSTLLKEHQPKGHVVEDRWLKNWQLAKRISDNKGLTPILRYLPHLKNTELNRYINLIGFSLAQILQKNDFKGVLLLDSEQVIMRLQGDWLVLSSNVINRLDNEAQLAGLLIHLWQYQQQRQEHSVTFSEVLNIEADKFTLLTMQSLGYTPQTWLNFLQKQQQKAEPLEVHKTNYSIRVKALNDWVKHNQFDLESGQMHQKRFHQFKNKS